MNTVNGVDKDSQSYYSFKKPFFNTMKINHNTTIYTFGLPLVVDWSALKSLVSDNDLYRTHHCMVRTCNS